MNRDSFFYGLILLKKSTGHWRIKLYSPVTEYLRRTGREKFGQELAPYRFLLLTKRDTMRPIPCHPILLALVVTSSLALGGSEDFVKRSIFVNSIQPYLVLSVSMWLIILSKPYRIVL
jgi:hypothetical protein